jgi:branched-chain amino acid transport system permease protein
MEYLLSQLLNGLAIGTIYALLAVGFSLVFGAARLINFAQGAFVVIGAYVAYWLVSAFAMPLPVAAVLATICLALVGLAVYRLGVQPMEKGPALAPLVSTLAIALILGQAAVVIWGAPPVAFPNPLSGYVMHVGATIVSLSDLVNLGAAIVAMAALRYFLNSTWAGRAIRATAQDRDAAAQMGVQTRKSAQLAFILAGGIGGISGVLVGMYYQSISPSLGVPFALKGFAAALLGGMGSLPGAIIGGYVIGVFESLTVVVAGEGLRDAVALSLLLLVLLIRPQGILGSNKLAALGGVTGAAGTIPGTSPLALPSGQPQGRAHRSRMGARALLAILIATCVIVVLAPNPYVLTVGCLIAIYSIAAIGTTIVSGSIGQISVSMAALVGCGAYCAALLARDLSLPLELVLPASGLVTACLALVLAVPTLELTGDAATLATLAVAEIGIFVFNNWNSVTGGVFGLSVPAPALAFSNGLELTSVSGQLLTDVIVLVLVAWASQRLLDSPMGRAWRAIREDRPAAHAAGIPVARYKLGAHWLGGLWLGIAGALLAYLLAYIDPESFTIDLALLLLTMVIVGGMGNLWGAVLGAAGITIVNQLLGPLFDLRVIVLYLILLVFLRFRPSGLVGSF